MLLYCIKNLSEAHHDDDQQKAGRLWQFVKFEMKFILTPVKPRLACDFQLNKFHLIIFPLPQRRDTSDWKFH